MSSDKRLSRRGFVSTTAAALGGAAEAAAVTAPKPDATQSENTTANQQTPRIEYPRRYSSEHLETISFPLGGVAAGSIGLGGRGQLRDWEIFNKPSHGKAPEYGFVSIWARREGQTAIARVLEAQIPPPYASSGGLGPGNAPGLLRLDSATFEGDFPFARIAFHDSELPVQVSLEAFTPFIPHDADDSGLPCAVLRYRVTNLATVPVEASLCFTLDNLIAPPTHIDAAKPGAADKRSVEYRTGNKIGGLFFSNPGLATNEPMSGSIFAGFLDATEGKLTYVRGWPRVKWWTSPLLFWDDFKADGEVGPEAATRKPTGSIALKHKLAPHASKDFTLVLAWHFPVRTAAWCGWTAPKGQENANLGNFYATRFADAFAAAEYLAANLASLEQRTRAFTNAIHESTLPPAVKDAAMSNLSTLVSTTCFRTKDGEFHGFEGSNNDQGCCFGNCTHVWNYETVTDYLFPQFARSLRRHAFGYAQADDGGIRFRQLLPDGKDRFGYAAADGQMGQVLHAYLDWQLSGDHELLSTLWPKLKKAIDYCWISGGWDSNRDGVLEGVQHNTYDVEFFGPNPLCQIYYLGALRAMEEMARAMNDEPAAAQYRSLFIAGRDWTDKNLFNGEYYVQQVRGIRKDQIAPSTVGDMGSESTERPDFQVGAGCLADQLIGQYLADLCSLGDLLAPANIGAALRAIHRYNFKPSLANWESVQRIYALNDEAATVVCDYGKGSRPQVPFPYFAEAWTGQEYLVASLMFNHGLVTEGLACVEAVRRRHDGRRRNPWDEFECGHHYARAMSSWSLIPAYSGFRYDGAAARITMLPRATPGDLVSFWSNAKAWGSFTVSARNRQFMLKLIDGETRCGELSLPRAIARTNVKLNGTKVPSSVTDAQLIKLSSPVVLKAGDQLEVGPTA